MGTLNTANLNLTGNILTPNRPAFRVKVTSHGGGETFGSDSGCTYTVAYGDVLPLFKSSERTVEQNVGGCISFHSYPTSTGTGEYLKFTAPVSGTYVFGFSVEMQIKSGDWTSLGFRKNTITPTNDFIEYSLNSFIAEGHVSSSRRRGHQSAQMIIELAANEYVVPGCQSHESSNYQNPANYWYGYLLG